MKMMKKKKYNMGGKVMKYNVGSLVGGAIGGLTATALKKLKAKMDKDKLKKTGAKKAAPKGSPNPGMKPKKPTPKTITLNMGGRVPTYAGMPMMAEGGMVKKKKKVSKKKSIDGVARRGRTKGRMV